MNARTSRIFSIAPILFGLLIALGFFFVGDPPTGEKSLGVRFALQSRLDYQPYKDYCIHTERPPDMGACWSSMNQMADNDSAVLWLGASQLFVISNAKDGDQGVVHRVNEDWFEKGVRTMALSMPNASLQELALAYLSNKLKPKPEWLMVGFVFDDLQHGDFRSGLVNDDAILNQIAANPYPWAQDYVDAFHPGSSDGPPAQANGLDAVQVAETTANRVEDFLERWLEDRSKIWRDRPAWREEVLWRLTELRQGVVYLRNALTGRDWADWEMNIPKASAEKNWGALGDLIDMARHDGVKVFLYVAPRPTDRKFPYIPSDYDAAKNRLRLLAENRSGVYFENWEDGVPNGLWGLTDIGFGHVTTDIFHVTGEGHKYLAKLFNGFVTSYVKPSAP